MRSRAKGSDAPAEDGARRGLPPLYAPKLLAAMNAGPRNGHSRASPLRSPLNDSCAARAVAHSPGKTPSTSLSTLRAFSPERAPSIYTLTRRAVAYIMAIPAVKPARFVPERARVLVRVESFRRSRATS
jgi:hypothetical protein